MTRSRPARPARPARQQTEQQETPGTALVLMRDDVGRIAEHVRSSAGLTAGQWPDAAIHTIARTVCPEATPSELAMFLAICARYQLDPRVRECWLAKDDRGRPIVLTGRDTMLTVAGRDTGFRGVTVGLVYPGEVYEVERRPDGRIEVRHQKRGFPEGKPVGGWALLERDGMLPVFVERLWTDYAYLHEKVAWKRDARGMFETRLVTAALRRAYTLSGLYSTAEWDSVTGEVEAESGTESLVRRTRDRMRGLRERMAGSQPVDAELVEPEPAEAEVESAADSGRPEDDPADEGVENARKAYFAMLHEKAPDWGDVERKLWQEQHGFPASTKDWGKQQFVDAMRVIESGDLSFEYGDGLPW